LPPELELLLLLLFPTLLDPMTEEPLPPPDELVPLPQSQTPNAVPSALHVWTPVVPVVQAHAIRSWDAQTVETPVVERHAVRLAPNARHEKVKRKRMPLPTTAIWPRASENHHGHHATWLT